MANATIENIEFTLFYDYDQLKDRKLIKLSDEGKIDWLHARMEMIFLEPVRRIIADESQPRPVLHSSEYDPVPPRTAAILAFSIVLNGVEAAGSFITPAGGNGQRFRTFMESYMKRWDKSVNKTDYTDTRLVSILWTHFRNGIAHQFAIEGGGVEYQHKKRWVVRQRMLQVNSRLFFSDFEGGLETFFRDVRTPGSAERVQFMRRFAKAYPH